MESRKKPNKEIYVPPARRSSQQSKVNGCGTHDTSPSPNKLLNDPTYQPQIGRDFNDVDIDFASLSISRTYEKSKPNVITEKTTVKNHTNPNKSAQKSNSASSNPSADRNEPSFNFDDFRHVIELYDFSKELQTLHLQSELRGFEDGGFHIKWVDDTHALAVFSSVSDANRALAQISGLFIKARPIKDASLPSKWKLATSPGDWAMPYKKRPPTTSSTARRMISNHLGLPVFKQKTAEQLQREKEDREALREARARANAIKQAQQAMWDD